MKPWIAIVAVAHVLAGCAGGYPGVTASNSGAGIGVVAPSDEEARNAYEEFRYRLACPDVENCDNVLWRQQPWISEVSQAECVRGKRPGTVRCSFLVHERISFGENLHQCAGLFRREGNQWTMLSVIGKCYGWPVGPAR